VGIIEWTERAQENCLDRYGSALHKGWESAKICPIVSKQGEVFNQKAEEYEASLNRSMANHIFESCNTKCVYDIAFTGVAYRWRTGNCWEMVIDKDCTMDGKDHKWAFDHITQEVCHVDIPSLMPTSVPTIQPTSVSTVLPTASEATEDPIKVSTCIARQCIPQQEWSEDLMEAYCSPDATGATYKHHCHVGRAAEPCLWFKALKDQLQKSLAMRLYSDCSSTCVFDYYSNAQNAWKWSHDDLCWELQAWGTCQWNFLLGRTQPQWDAAKARMLSICASSV